MLSWFPLRRLPTRVVDALVVVWVAIWLVMGAIAAGEIRDLQALSVTLADAGRAIDTAGRALETLGAIPLVGDGPEQLGEEVRTTAAAVTASAFETRDSVETLSIVLGISIAFMPTVPIVSIYVPWRIYRSREADAAKRALREAVDDPAFEEFLARRAVQHLPFEVLRAITPTPWRDLEEGRFRALANAELTAMGLAGNGSVTNGRKAGASVGSAAEGG